MADLGEWGSDTAAESTEDLPELRYPTVDRFVEEWLVHACWVDTSAASRIWCPSWWLHVPALVRLEALHRSWEQARLDPAAGMATWLRDVADYHLAYLMDPHGPFKGCSTAKGHQPERDRVIPVDRAPAGMFLAED